MGSDVRSAALTGRVVVSDSDPGSAMFERTRLFIHRLAGGRSAAPAGTGDRRAWQRFAASRQTIIQAELDGAAPQTARIDDVSRVGIRLAVTQPITQGAMIRVDLPLAEGQPNTAVLACVVHVTANADRTFSLGCSLSTELSDAELNSLGAGKKRTDAADARAWERVPVRGRAVYRRVGADRANHIGRIHNVSPTGVALEVNEPIEPGVLLDVELQNEFGQTVVTIVSCVVYTRELEGAQRLLGCNFIRELDDEDIQGLIGPAI